MFANIRSCNRWNTKFAGKIAGTVNNNGYVRINNFGKLYQAHRLAFLYMEGTYPDEQVDHIDHNRGNNKWSNLRPATHSENSRNLSLSSRNTSNIIGVYWYKGYQKWRAAIKINGKFKHIGYFSKKTDATKARKQAEIKYGFHANHGQPMFDMPLEQKPAEQGDLL